jgi:hypothetical protein
MYCRIFIQAPPSREGNRLMKDKVWWWRTLVVPLLSILLVGCAVTRMTSQINPECLGHRFEKVLVYGNFQSLEQRQLAEEKLCSKLTHTATCECLKSSDVFFPGQEYSGMEIGNRLFTLGIDGVLTFQPMSSGTSSTYTPPTSYTTGSAQIFGNTIIGSSRTHTYGGYNVSKPWSNYKAVLWSTAERRVVWYATGTAGGNAFAGWDDLIKSAAGKTVSQLAADGVLR